MLKIDGFDDAIIGVGYRCGQEEILVYDRDKIINIIMENSESSYEEAEEYLSFNIEGAWMGEDTPIIVQKFDKQDLMVYINKDG